MLLTFLVAHKKKKVKKMLVTITNPKEVVVVREQKKSYTTLTIQRIVDMIQIKKVVVFTEEISEPIVLWEDESYDSLGDWTKDMVSNRLNEMYGSSR